MENVSITKSVSPSSLKVVVIGIGDTGLNVVNLLEESNLGNQIETVVLANETQLPVSKANYRIPLGIPPMRCFMSQSGDMAYIRSVVLKWYDKLNKQPA